MAPPFTPSTSAFHGRCLNIHPFHPAPAIHTEPTWTPFSSSALNHHPRTLGQFLPEWRDSTTIIISATASTIPGIIKFLRSPGISMAICLLYKEFLQLGSRLCQQQRVKAARKLIERIGCSSFVAAGKVIHQEPNNRTHSKGGQRPARGWQKFRRQDRGHHLYPTGNRSLQVTAVSLRLLKRQPMYFKEKSQVSLMLFGNGPVPKSPHHLRRLSSLVLFHQGRKVLLNAISHHDHRISNQRLLG